MIAERGAPGGDEGFSRRCARRGEGEEAAKASIGGEGRNARRKKDRAILYPGTR